MKHLELFSGIGGFRYALDLFHRDTGVPVECVGYSEIDIKAKTTYRSNFNISKEEIDLGDIVIFNTVKSNIENLPNFDLLTAGFPCQSFSMMGKQLGFEDNRGNLFFEILQILKLKKPKYILLENVKNLFNHDKGQTFQIIKQSLEDLGYNIFFDIFNTNKFHLAQIRNRVIIFGILDSEVSLNFSSEKISTFFDEIVDISSVKKQQTVLDVLQKEVLLKYFLSEKIKPTILSDGSGKFKANSEINKLQARPLTASMHKMHRACQDNYYSLDFILTNAKIDSSKILTKEELAKESIRRLTPEEAFELQGFPADFCIKARKEKVSDGSLYKQAGNAISVNVIYAILRYLYNENIFK